jgi:hypothetical protein
VSEVKLCIRCGKVEETSPYTGVCSVCAEKEEKDFDIIREYLYAHPHAKILEVALELDMSISKIKLFLRQGRLEIVEKENLFLKCEACGCPICSGSYCSDCAMEQQHDIKSAYFVNSPNNLKGKLSYMSSRY